MFKVGEIVKYSPKFCGDGEEYFIHMVKEADRGHYLISTLNSPLILGSTERVTEEMLQKAKKYEILFVRDCELNERYIITDTEEKKFFAGYDFMGSVDWSDGLVNATGMEIEEAEDIVKDLESADMLEEVPLA